VAQGPHRWVKLEEAGDSEEGGAVTQAGRRHELGGVSMAALGGADEVAEWWLGGAVMLTCVRRTDGELRQRPAQRGATALTVETRRWHQTGPVGTTVSLKMHGANDLVSVWRRCAKRPLIGGPGRK
jgi:hypothetical protein